MRRMNYPRFDKPTYFSTINPEGNTFYFDHEIENGIYVVIITDTEDGDTYTLFLTVQDNFESYADFQSTLSGDQSIITFTPFARDHIAINSGVSNGATTMALYKIN